MSRTCRPNIAGEHREIDLSGEHAIEPGNFRSGGSTRNHDDFKSAFEKFAQVGFDAEIGGLPARMTFSIFCF
jgi:hypothetical protein